MLDPGIHYKTITITSGTSFIRNFIKFIKIDPGRFEVKVLSSHKLGYKNGFFVRSVAEKENAALVINGSYFDKNRTPLGFLVSDGKELNKRIVTNWIYSGIFYISRGRPFLKYRENFTKAQPVEQALQAGPRLMENGKPIEKIKNLHASHFRTGIGLTVKNKIITFVTDTGYGGITWFELQQILVLPGLELQSAMNLDGGGSTQMALKTRGMIDYVDGASKVPVAIGFFKKKK